jgi:PAS domain S-box-containing protein
MPLAEKELDLLARSGDMGERLRALDWSREEYVAWLVAQKEAFESALNSDSLETSLGLLIRWAIEQYGPGTRAAFYLANPQGTELRHIVGMPAEYAKAVEGFKIGPESLACGLATHTGQPVITPDVTREPLWQPWLWMAAQFDYRGCWSFPVHTSACKFVATFALYFRMPREATLRDHALAFLVTDTAGVIVARHITAEEHQRSEERLRAIVTSATDAIITIDAEQKVTLFNAGAEATFGYSAKEMIGQKLDRLVPEQFRGAHRRHVDAFGRTGTSMRVMGGERVLSGLRRNGEEFPMEARISQVDVGGQKFYTVILRDIAERKRVQAERDELLALAERARGEAEAAVRVLGHIQTITEGAIVDLPLDQLLVELVGRVREALAADTTVLLLKEDEVLHARAAVGLQEKIRGHVSVPVGRGFAGRIAKERRPMVVNGVRYDDMVSGQLFREKGIRSAVGVPLLSGEGRVLGVLQVGCVRSREFTDDDVRLLQLAGERVALGIERAARADAERHARETLELSNRRKDEFLAMLGHELRNPLSAIRNAVTTASLDESRRARALEIARRQTDQLGRLIDDLLDVARITQGRIMLRKERVDLAQIIERAVESTRSFIESRGVRVAVLLTSERIRVEADPARLEQVFVNLLSNAAKFTEPDGLVDVVAERQGEKVVVRVRDTGIGIAPETLPHIWDLFTQADRTLDRAPGGLGIGLTVARGLVELHGARIEAHSDGIGKGAEFVVIFPVPPATDEIERPAVSDARVRQRYAHILLVEDNADAAESLKMLLELLGHRVHVVYEGISALAAVRSDEPDVMLVDIGLPGIDGYEVARRVRRDFELKHVRLIALTGYGREEDKQRATAAGFDYHLAKPVNLDALQGLIAELETTNGKLRSARLSDRANIDQPPEG